MKTKLYIISFLLIYSINYGQDIDSIKNRIKDYYISQPYINEYYATWIASQNPDGSWSDINYETWPYSHLYRLQDISKAYAEVGNEYYGDTAVLHGIGRGLDYWHNLGFEYTNWWYNEIGEQQIYAPILYKTMDSLALWDFDILDSMATRLADPDYNCNFPAEGGAPCQASDLLEKSIQAICKGAIYDSTELIEWGLDSIKSQCYSIEGRLGIQPDNSYHYHGAQLYSNGYGNSFFILLAQYVNYTRELSFKFDSIDIANLSLFVLDHLQWTNYNGYHDFSTVGREIARTSSGLLNTADDEIDYMIKNDTNRSDEYQAFYDNMDLKSPSIKGFRYWPLSDYAVFRDSLFSFSVKMCSNRTTGTEIMNGENKKGYYLPFGATCIQRRGEEYYYTYPLWDWYHVAGTTTPKTMDKDFPLDYYYIYGTTEFVGSVSDSSNGISAMDLDWVGVTGKKSWFMFDSVIVCLGAGITGDEGDTINTTINQGKKFGKIYYNDGDSIENGKSKLTNPTWIWHDSIGYYIDDDSVFIENESRSGNWDSIGTSNTAASGNIFSIYLNHGVDPSDATYSYAIYPNIDTNDMNRYLTPLYIVLANTDSIQAVTYGNKIGIVFYKPFSIILGGVNYEVSDSCILLIEGSNVYASKPTNNESTLNVSVDNKEAEIEIITTPFGGLTYQGQVQIIPDPKYFIPGKFNYRSGSKYYNLKK